MNYSPVPDDIASIPSSRIALVHGDRSLTYGELNQRADRLAAYLLQSGLTPEATVAICLERSPEWVIAALAVMRAGACYLPVDLAWPDERLNFVLRDAAVSHLIAAPCVRTRLRTEATHIDLIADAAQIASTPNPSFRSVPPQSLAYVIYTSGSTGTPKGVEITHANLSNLVAWHREQFSITSADRASHLAGLSFDAAGWEIWPYLAAGAAVCMAGEMERTSPAMLQRWLLAQKVSVAFAPTVLAAGLCDQPWPQDTALRFLLTGGDTLHRRPQSGLPFKLVNNYGPTECTVVATSGPVHPSTESAPTIGKAIHGAAIYLLDEQGAPVATGVVGEICVGGAGVGRGYRNLPALTRAAFVPDPFSALPAARMYRTGDRGVLRLDGEIEFRGRADTQEKIRGQRVELDEIGSVLNRHPALSSAVVAASLNDQQEKVLVAYVVPASASALTSSQLQHFLTDHLPSYMIPSLFVQLRAMPLTVNGKIDRSALPSPDESTLLPAVAGRTTLNPVEARLLAMVRQLLATDQVGVADDFFLAGGHSLLGTQLVLRVRAAFGVDLTLRHLFESATAERLAVTVERLMIAQVEQMTDEEAMQQMGVLA